MFGEKKSKLRPLGQIPLHIYSEFEFLGQSLWSESGAVWRKLMAGCKNSTCPFGWRQHSDIQPPTECLRGGVWTWSGAAEPDTSLLHPPFLLEPMKKWWSSEGKRSKDGVFLYMFVLLHVSLLSLIKKYYCNIENTHTNGAIMPFTWSECVW